jgi:replicative DNA helicase
MSTAPPPIAPQNLEAEQALLGAMLASSAAVDTVISEAGVRADDFYRRGHQLTFEAVLSLYGRGEPVDHLTVTNALRERGDLEAAGGDAGVQLLIGQVPSVGHVKPYAALVRETARQRALLQLTYEIQAGISAGQSTQETLALAERGVLDLASVGRRGTVRNIAEIAYDEVERIHRASLEGLSLGIKLPFAALDEGLGSLMPMNLAVICGRPGMGKSVVGQEIAEHAAFHQDKTVLFFTLEMSAEELAQRYLADEGNISHHVLRRHLLTHERDVKRLVDTIARAADKKLLVHEGLDLTVTELRAIARKTALREKGLDLVVVDYLQLLSAGSSGRSRSETREQIVSGFAEGLKSLARELNCPVVALAQLNRAVEARNDKRPLLSDLRESGAIEQAADLVLSVYRADYYEPETATPGETELAVLKARHGALGIKAVVTLDGPHLRLVDQREHGAAATF